MLLNGSFALGAPGGQEAGDKLSENCKLVKTTQGVSSSLIVMWYLGRKKKSVGIPPWLIP